MAEVKLQKLHDRITKSLDEKVTRAKSAEAFLRLKIFPIYQKAQNERFMSGNTTEGAAWPAISSTYASYKQKRYKGYPYGGSKVNIATSTLFYGVAINPDRVITSSSMVISPSTRENNPETGKSLTSYAKYANAERPFMKFGSDTTGDIKRAIRRWMLGDR